jgi:hypothetical protein
VLKKRIWAIFQRIIKLITQKIVTKLSKYGFGSGIRDPRSGIRKKPIPDPGSRGQKGTGSRIRIRNTAKKLGGHRHLQTGYEIQNRAGRSHLEFLLFLPSVSLFRYNTSI